MGFNSGFKWLRVVINKKLRIYYKHIIQVYKYIIYINIYYKYFTCLSGTERHFRSIKVAATNWLVIPDHKNRVTSKNFPLFFSVVFAEKYENVSCCNSINWKGKWKKKS